jgi:PAS domain S-box-containing protein
VTGHSLFSDPNVKAMVVNFRDITERKLAERSIKFQAHLLDTVEQAVIATDLDGSVIYWNKFAEKLYGWSPAEAIGRNILEITLPETTRDRALKIMSYLREGNSWSGEFLVQRKDSTSFPVMVTNSPIYDDKGQLIGIVGVSFDTTEFRRAEEARRKLLQRLFTTQEEERHRIARELHDQMGQYLAALMMGLKSVEKSTELSSPIRNRIVELQELTTQFSKEVRHFSLDLRPTALDDLGLHDALMHYVEEWSERNDIKIDFHSNGLVNERLLPHIETALYRLIQEALNNVLKHAQAHHVSVILENRGNSILAILEDDGIGFDVAAALNAPVSERGLGLTGMCERIESVGGTLKFESTPGSGSTIVARIPAPSPEQRAVSA